MLDEARELGGEAVERATQRLAATYDALAARGRRRAGPPRPRPAARPRLLHRRHPRGLRPGARPRARRRRALRRADGPLRPTAAGGRLRALPRAASTSPRRRRSGWRGRRAGSRPARDARRGPRAPRAAEARGAAGGAVRGHARPARPDRGRDRRAARRLALAGLRRRRAGAGHHASLRRPDLRRGGRGRPRDHRQGRPAEQRDRAVYELLDLGYGACRMVLAGAPRATRASARRSGAWGRCGSRPSTRGRPSATSSETGRQAEVIEVKGSVELAPLVGLADGIVDLVDTGRTLAENELEVREEIAAARPAWSPTGWPTSCARRRSTRWPSGYGRRRRSEDRAHRAGTAPTRRGARGTAASAGARRSRRSRPRSREIVARFAAAATPALRELAERSARRPPERSGSIPRRSPRRPGLLDPDVREALRVAAREHRGGGRAPSSRRSTRPGDGRAARGPAGRGARRARSPPPASTRPAGTAAYPSSVLMCCVPARVAGVARVAVATPARARRAARRRRARRLRDRRRRRGLRDRRRPGDRRAGASGPRRIAPVDLIAGPGNRYVTEAKRQVSPARSGSTGSPGPAS